MARDHVQLWTERQSTMRRSIASTTRRILRKLLCYSVLSLLLHSLLILGRKRSSFFCFAWTLSLWIRLSIYSSRSLWIISITWHAIGRSSDLIISMNSFVFGLNTIRKRSKWQSPSHLRLLPFDQPRLILHSINFSQRAYKTSWSGKSTSEHHATVRVRKILSPSDCVQGISYCSHIIFISTSIYLSVYSLSLSSCVSDLSPFRYCLNIVTCAVLHVLLPLFHSEVVSSISMWSPYWERSRHHSVSVRFVHIEWLARYLYMLFL